jgi:hypothetical protein
MEKNTVFIAAKTASEVLTAGDGTTKGTAYLVIDPITGALLTTATITGAARYGKVSFTRPNNTTPYSAGDAIGTGSSAILEFTSFGVSGDLVLLNEITLEIDVAAVPSGMSSFKLHFFNASPTAIIDNAVLDIAGGDRALYLGYATLTLPLDMGSTLYSMNVGLGKMVKLAGTSLFAILTTDAAYTPSASTVKTLTIQGAVV